jgi:hypothetical protein
VISPTARVWAASPVGCYRFWLVLRFGTLAKPAFEACGDACITPAPARWRTIPGPASALPPTVARPGLQGDDVYRWLTVGTALCLAGGAGSAAGALCSSPCGQVRLSRESFQLCASWAQLCGIISGWRGSARGGLQEAGFAAWAGEAREGAQEVIPPADGDACG